MRATPRVKALWPVLPLATEGSLQPACEQAAARRQTCLSHASRASPLSQSSSHSPISSRRSGSAILEVLLAQGGGTQVAEGADLVGDGGASLLQAADGGGEWQVEALALLHQELGNERQEYWKIAAFNLPLGKRRGNQDNVVHPSRVSCWTQELARWYSTGETVELT